MSQSLTLFCLGNSKVVYHYLTNLPYGYIKKILNLNFLNHKAVQLKYLDNNFKEAEVKEKL